MSHPCGKIGHATRAEAERQRAYVRGKHGRLNVYQCDRCSGLWHIGRKPQGKSLTKRGRP